MISGYVNCLKCNTTKVHDVFQGWPTCGPRSAEHNMATLLSEKMFRNGN